MFNRIWFEMPRRKGLQSLLTRRENEYSPERVRLSGCSYHLAGVGTVLSERVRLSGCTCHLASAGVLFMWHELTV